MTSKPNKFGDGNETGSDTNEDLSEITVVRPRSVLDEAFDAHTVVRPEAKRTLNPPVSNTGEFPPPPPMPNARSSWPPEPIAKSMVQNDSKANDLDLTRVSPIPMPPIAPPAGPSSAELEAQALQVAQERARLKAQHAAEQAMQKAALAQAEAARESARRAAEDTLRENVRRHQQVARETAIEDVQRRESVNQPVPPPPSIEDETGFALEPARRQIPWKWIAAAVVFICLGSYLFGGTNRVGQGDSEVVAKDSSKSVDSGSSLYPQKDEDAINPGEAVSSTDVKSIQSLLSAFDDAFSRTQVRSRPESQD